jgi:PTH1 family peptidyl-tRNA hydrolase
MIIVGLGNPGEKYKETRHNTGFQVVDKFAEKNNFPEFKLSKKFNSLVSEGIFNDEKIVLAKPQTFMNNSGVAVKKISANHKLKTTNLIVIHDDIDLPLGKIKIVKNRGSAGHKGVESIIKSLGNNDFVRIRIGILPKIGKPKNQENFVLQKFTKEEKTIIEKTTARAISSLDSLVQKGLEITMNEYNKQD